MLLIVYFEKKRIYVYNGNLIFLWTLFSIIVLDPSLIEESVCTSNAEEGGNRGGILVVGMNQYKELCLLNLTGAALYNSSIVHKALLSASDRCKEVVDMVKKIIFEDDNLR